MNRTSMARQIEDPPMKTAKKMARGGKVKMARGGMAGKMPDNSMVRAMEEGGAVKKMRNGNMSKKAEEEMGSRTRGGAVKKMRGGGMVMMARGGKVKGKDDQSMCSPRKQMAMGKK